MKELVNTTYLIPWLISNIIALLMLWVALKRPKITRLLFFLLFAWACWMNYTTSHQTPEVYLQYASLSIKWYRPFIVGWFSRHITDVVSAIAIVQGFLAVGMLLKGWWVKTACIGIIIFLIAIAPLGIGSEFPSTLTAAVAAFILLRKPNHPFIWKRE